MHRPDSEDWATWHTHTWRVARDQVHQSWGGSPAVYATARAVGGVQHSISRSASSVVGRLIRWRSDANLSTMRTRADGRLGPWTRQRKGRPRRRWEITCVSPATRGGKAPTIGIAARLLPLSRHKPAALLIESARSPRRTLPPPLPRSPAGSPHPVPPSRPLCSRPPIARTHYSCLMCASQRCVLGCGRQARFDDKIDRVNRLYTRKQEATARLPHLFRRYCVVLRRLRFLVRVMLHRSSLRAMLLAHESSRGLLGATASKCVRGRKSCTDTLVVCPLSLCALLPPHADSVFGDRSVLTGCAACRGAVLAFRTRSAVVRTSAVSASSESTLCG